MENPIQNYWNLRLKKVKDALEENNFQVFIADNAQQAKELVERDNPGHKTQEHFMGWVHNLYGYRPLRLA